MKITPHHTKHHSSYKKSSYPKGLIKTPLVFDILYTPFAKPYFNDNAGGYCLKLQILNYF